MKKQQSGFTLIELIIVIVILGILAVTAAPKFIDIQSDATSSTMKGVQAALQGGSQLVYAKSAIAGLQTIASSETPTVEVSGLDIAIDFGYPSAASFTAIRTATLAVTDIATFADLSAADWTYTANHPGTGSFAITPSGRTAVAIDDPATGDADTRCQVIYNDAADRNTPPTVIAYTGGC